MSTTREQLIADIEAVSFGIVEITPDELAKYFEKYVHFGSKRYTLSKSDLTVFHLPDRDFEGKSDIQTVEINGKKIPKTLSDHLKCGTKFLDAVLYMHLPEGEKPDTLSHPEPAAKEQKMSISTYDEHPKIARYMFFYYFYILTRARAPETETGPSKQPVPNFLGSVLSISKSAGEVADYLASFELNNLDPAWVRKVELNGLSRESLARFGLGVAGYRMAHPFKIRDPDAPEHEKYAPAVKVAKSFATSPACWDFHPATRHPNVLQRYGNVNKNLSNLLLKVFKEETLKIMVEARIIFQMPKEEPNYTNYLKWDESFVYTTSAPIFPSMSS